MSIPFKVSELIEIFSDVKMKKNPWLFSVRGYQQIVNCVILLILCSYFIPFIVNFCYFAETC